MTNIIIPLTKSSQGDCEELRYALRSIDTHFKCDNLKITLIGYKPKWIQNVSHIAYDDSKFPRYKNAYNKIKIASKTFTDFIWWHDDMYLLKDVDCEFFKNNYFYLQDLKKVKRFGNRFYQQRLKDFLSICLLKGFPAYNYATHTPYYFKSVQIDIALKAFGIDKTQECFFIENYVYNYYDKSSIAKQIYPYKVGRYDATSIDCEKDFKDKLFANFDEAGLKSGIFDCIKEKFKTKSRYEL